MFLTEYDEERTLAFLKKESYEDGVKEARIEHVITIMYKLNMQVDEAADFLEIPEEERPDIIAEIEKRKEL